MTVCIAAVNTQHKSVVFATDRMVTGTYPPIEFEHSIPKIVEINEYCIALASGSALKGKKVFDLLQDYIKGKTPPVKEIAEGVKSIYQQRRLQDVEDLLLKSRGIDHKTFFEKGGKLLPPPIYQQIDHLIGTFDFQLELIIAGVDHNEGSIYGIRNPGIIECYNTIGFHAIGTGTMHALSSLIATYRPECGIAESLYSVFRAKRIAEVAPGVGELLDVGVIGADQKIKYFDENADLFKEMSNLYKLEKRATTPLTGISKLDTIFNNANVGDHVSAKKGAQLETGNRSE